ncbi:class I SAM-dependent methyltransferase [Actinoplanes sp. NPDC023714]|uniref:class I SAM-dependent methyltransferase n=1 Tax=Actinoplanes sp. NPDC023714 TaxID=3154322 RepID=UPI0033FBA9FF
MTAPQTPPLRRRIVLTAVRTVKRWAPATVRRRLWDSEYAAGRWDFLDTSQDDLPNTLITKFADGGRILDLGCGTTQNLHLEAGGYALYHGVDISPDAIARARALGRPDSAYDVADVVSYPITGRYDLILLREVIYYLPLRAAARLVRRCGDSLTDGGVVAVIIWNTEMYGRTAAAARRCGLPIVDEFVHAPGAVTLLFGPPATR